MPSFAELALASAKNRPTPEQVAGLMEADMAAREQAVRRDAADRKRRERIEREAARRAAVAAGERAHDSAAAGIAKVAGR